MESERILLMFYNRDEQALEETVNEYGVLCRSVARNILGSDEDAEECLNDALLTVWNAIPPAKPKNYCAYLLKLVRNAAFDKFKARKSAKRGGGQTTEALDELSEIFPSADNVETEVEQREMMQAVTKFLEQLPKHQRDLFLCRYWQAMSISDLAVKFHMTENNVKVTLSRLRKRLETDLREEGLL